jgi:hypothetical protein
MSRLVMLPITRQWPEFRSVSALICSVAWRGAHRTWHCCEVLRSKSPEAGYLTEVRELIQDSDRLHRNKSGVPQPYRASCYRRASDPVGDRFTPSRSATWREGWSAKAGSHTTARHVSSPLRCRPGGDRPSYARGGQDMEAIELSSRWEARMTFPNPPVATVRVARITQRDPSERRIAATRKRNFAPGCRLVTAGDGNMV